MKERKELNRSIKGRAVTAALSLLIIGFIFSNSLQTADVSGERSGKWLVIINDILVRSTGVPITEFVLRKLAHFGEFAMLGSSLIFTWREWQGSFCKKTVLYSIVSGFFVACADECLQIFSEGRTAKWMDVGIDTLGCSFGVLLACGFLLCLRRKWLWMGNGGNSRQSGGA